jgi:phage protein D
MKPIYQITIDGNDKTEAMAPFLMNVALKDQVGFKSDSLELELNNQGGALVVPEMGKEIRVALGYEDTGLVDKGLFIIDELELRSPPEILRVHARATNLRQGLTCGETKTWKDTTLGDICSEIASANGMDAVVAPELEFKAIASIQQESETPLQFLSRLAKSFDALFKCTVDKLLLMPRASQTTPSGTPLPSLTLKRQQVQQFSLKLPDRPNIKKVTAFWQEPEKAKQHKIEVEGNGEGACLSVPNIHASEAEATEKAQALLAEKTRATKKLSMTCHGLPDLIAQMALELPEQDDENKGFAPAVAGRYRVVEVSHQLNDSGYTSRLTAESMD